MNKTFEEWWTARGFYPSYEDSKPIADMAWRASRGENDGYRDDLVKEQRDYQECVDNYDPTSEQDLNDLSETPYDEL